MVVVLVLGSRVCGFLFFGPGFWIERSRAKDLGISCQVYVERSELVLATCIVFDMPAVPL